MIPEGLNPLACRHTFATVLPATIDGIRAYFGNPTQITLLRTPVSAGSPHEKTVHNGGDARLYSSRGLITQGNLSVMILQVPVAWLVWTASAAAGTSGGLPVRRPGRGLRRCLAVGRAGAAGTDCAGARRGWGPAAG